MTGVPDPRLYAPPPEPEGWQDRQRGIGAWRFPEWFVVQESGAGKRSDSGTGSGSGTRPGARSRRLVPRTALTNGRYEKKPVVATRFVRACSRGEPRRRHPHPAPGRRGGRMARPRAGAASGWMR